MIVMFFYTGDGSYRLNAARGPASIAGNAEPLLAVLAPAQVIDALHQERDAGCGEAHGDDHGRHGILRAGERGAAVRRGAFVCFAKRGEESFRGRSDKRSTRPTSRGRAPSTRGFRSRASREARARGTYQRRAPEVDVSLRSLDGRVFERGGEVSARSRREARARASEGSASRVCTMPSLASPRISLLGWRPRGGSTERRGGGERVPSGPRRRSEASLLRKTRAWDARL